ncbi:MAG TPA: hypothetical protein VGL77_21405 [Armatimonadota bacterium]|jgi:phosphomannomutase
MSDIAGLWEELAQARRELVRAAVGEGAPPRAPLARLEGWTLEMATVRDGAVTAGHMAQAWGQLQLLMIDGGVEDPASAHAPAWRRVRRAVEEAFEAILARPEWRSMQADLRETVLPHLADAVGMARAGRVTRCREAIEQLQALAHRTSGLPHAWRIRRVMEMQYPDITADGWLGRMGLDFDARRAHAVTRAVLEEMAHSGWQALPLLVGYDSRVQADQVATWVADVASAQGQPVLLCRRDTPLPALLAYQADTLRGASAGLLYSSAGQLPLNDLGAGHYSGHAYQGLRYYLPTGALPPAAMRARLSRRAAELLLDTPEMSEAAEAPVEMINLLLGYAERSVAQLGHLILMPDEEESLARDVLTTFWGQPEARIVIDEMHGATRGYLPAICTALGLPYEVLHDDAHPLFGELGAANPEPPHLYDLATRVKELHAQHHPVIGLAFDATGERLGVVDDTGAYLSPGSVLAVLAAYLLTLGYPGEPGMVARTRTATRMLDRLVAAPPFAGHTVPPYKAKGVPAYMCQEAYRHVAGDPHWLHGPGILVTDDPGETRPTSLLIAGDALGGITLPGQSGQDALQAAVLLLLCCAARRSTLREVVQQVSMSIPPLAHEHSVLFAPERAREALINGYLDRYARVVTGQLQASEHHLGGYAVRYAGGVRGQYVEWALRITDEQTAYLTLSQAPPLPALRIDVEAPAAEQAYHLLVAVAERLEQALVEALQHADTPWDIVDMLAHITSPRVMASPLPGTLNCHLAGEAYARLQELAHPGHEAPVLLRFVTACLREVQPESARALAACHLGEEIEKKKVPPPPHVHWESEGEA